MTLGTHAIVGAAVASFIPTHPALGFIAGFLSHFLIDAIPHRDYAIRSAFVDPSLAGKAKFDKALVLDAVTIGADAAFGVFLSLLFFAVSGNWWAILAGAIGGILPDPLQFAYSRFPHEPLSTLQRFHRWIHTSHRLKSHLYIGVFSQAVFVVAVVAAVYAFNFWQR